MPCGIGLIGCILILRREAQVAILLAPGRPAALDGEAGCFGDADPRIAVGRMKPAAAEIERMPGDVDRLGAAADPLRGFQQQGGQPACRQPARGSNTRCPAADDDDIPISAHTIPVHSMRSCSTMLAGSERLPVKDDEGLAAPARTKLPSIGRG